MHHARLTPSSAGTPDRLFRRTPADVGSSCVRLKVEGSGAARGLQVQVAIPENRKRELDFRFTFDGWIRVPSDGLYVFFVSSDDGVRLSVNDEEVLVYDGLHGMEERVG